MPPLAELLQDSCFYPACGCDPRPVLALWGRVCNFIYVDYSSQAQGDFSRLVASLSGQQFRCLEQRPIGPSDLWPQREAWPDAFHRSNAPHVERGFWDAEPWGIWARFLDVRKPEGSPALNLLLLGTEGIAAYRELYVASGIAPTWLALLRPGCGMGGGWTDFWTESPFAEAMQANPAGLPLGILCDDYRPYPPSNLGTPYREVPLASPNPLLECVQAFRRNPGMTSVRRGFEMAELLLGVDGRGPR